VSAAAAPPSPPALGPAVPHAPHDHAFAAGYRHGITALAQLPADAPFSADQRAWLCGYFNGLFAPDTSAPKRPALQAPDSNGRGFEEAAEEPAPGPVAAEPTTLPPTSEPRSTPRNVYSRHNPYAARVLEITPLGSESIPTSWHLTLDIEGSGIASNTCDLLSVFPANDPDHVRRILRLLGARGQEIVVTQRGSGPAWRALLEELNLQVVQPELIWLLSSCAQDAEEKAQLETLLQRGEIHEESVVALMRRFPSARPALDEFTAALTQLLPQTFPLVSTGSQHAEALEALMAVDPEGPSGIVADLLEGRLKAGDWLPIYVEPRPQASPPLNSGTPVILVAHGRSTASARAFFAERSTSRNRGRNWLFASPEAGATEVHYARQFAAWQSARVLARLDVAPRDLLIERFRAQFEMVHRWLTDQSTLYIFGDERECLGFRAALTELLVERTRVPVEEALVRLDSMQTTGQLRFVSV
jgi:sulfite reductase (NADPH) flavoprotein alpha-component